MFIASQHTKRPGERSGAQKNPGPEPMKVRGLCGAWCATAPGLFGGHFLPLHGFVSVVLHFGLVLDDLAIDFVSQKVDGSVEVFITRFAMDVFAGQADSHFSNMLQLLDREHDLYVNDVVEVSTYARHLLRCIFADGGGDFEMTTSNAQVHINAPTVRGLGAPGAGVTRCWPPFFLCFDESSVSLRRAKSSRTATRHDSGQSRLKDSFRCGGKRVMLGSVAGRRGRARQPAGAATCGNSCPDRPCARPRCR